MRQLLILSLTVALAATCVRAQKLDDLPQYQPEQKVSGTIRSFGFSLGGMMPVWEQGFRKFHPDVHFDDKFPSGDVAIAGLVSGVSDLGPQGRELVLTEYLAFFETFRYYPTDVTVMTGAYDVEGMACGLVVYVNKDNPISKLTMKQLDGIFGSERVGGLRGFKWTLEAGRGANDDIRTWGQLGLTGEWADKPIHTYGHAPSGTTNFFQLKVLNGGDKWNPNYQGYVETGSKMIADNDKDQLGGLQHMLKDELANDKYGIAWTVIPQARKVPGLKPIALAARDGGPYVEPTKENFQNRSYPLARSIYVYLNRAPGQPLDPKVKEFLRYVLSREGQEAVEREGKYLPLTAAVVREQLKKLE
ncbi:MAG: phosphate transport system substrate-binding protein [Acidobacteriota bacterium]|nr:phosphate transport system substrate-binding protein [Acidobacteriota bacterium]MDT7777802.1 phosphate transport system substrate-binding protein [Acidobacteriota bacterium]